MNYYRRYVGNYLKKTARLSLLEHGAYNLMLDYYYAEEKPLPGEAREVYRLVRALDRDEQHAIDRVLEKFFVLQDDGYHNERADEELGIASKVIETARENGKLGGRPKTKNITREETQDETENGTGNITGDETGTVTRDEPANNHPSTTNHLTASRQPPTANQVQSNVGQDARRILAFLNEKAQRRYQANRVNLGFVLARLKDGATEVECRQVIAKKCREWGNDPKMAEYLRPATLFNATKFAQYQGELVAPDANVSRDTSAAPKWLEGSAPAIEQ